MNSIFRIAFSATITAGLLASIDAHATDYDFTVDCESSRHVEAWHTGAIDPGREYLRAITGTKNPDCSISDFDPNTDSHLPRENYSDWGGIANGIPGGGILCGIFGC